MNKIPEDKLSYLEAPITEEEIIKMLKETPAGKCPRPDGLMTLYYKKFKDILIPKMCSYMNGIRAKWEMRKKALEATITIILKEGKDSTLYNSYRPISLLNTDTKLFAKVLAEKMKIIMNDIVQADQVGFIPGREGRDNGIRTLLAVQKIKDSKAPGLLLSINAEKAFDRVD